MHAYCMLSHFSHVLLFVIWGTIDFRLLCPWDFPGKSTGSGLPFFSSRGYSRPRDQTHLSCVSCIAVGCFTHWAMWAALDLQYFLSNGFKWSQPPLRSLEWNTKKYETLEKFANEGCPNYWSVIGEGQLYWWRSVTGGSLCFLSLS